MRKYLLHALIISFVFLSIPVIHSAENKTLSEVELLREIVESPEDIDINNLMYFDFNKIQVLDKALTLVVLQGNTEKIGLFEDELTAYMRLRIKNNFANIDLKDVNIYDYKPYNENASKSEEEVGMIVVNVWTVGAGDRIAVHLRCSLITRENPTLWKNEALGCSSEDEILYTIKRWIDSEIEALATEFFKVRGEL